VRDLAALLATPAGRRFLAEAGTSDDPDAFLAALRAPRAAPAEAARPVFVHQQVYLDYRASVVAKLLALRDLARRAPALEPCFLWIDTDRAGADKLSLRLYLSTRQGRTAVRLAPAGCEDRESRFIPLDPARLAAGLDRIASLIGGRPGGGGRAAERFAALRPLLAPGGTLADLGRRWSDALFAATLGWSPAALRVSDLVADGALRPALTLLLNRRADFVAAVNTRIAALRDLGIQPALRPLPGDYLPLFMTDPHDGRRRRLRLERDGPLQLAVAAGSGERRHRFPLGRETLSLDALEAGAAWSPDVTLPLLLAAGFSGLVAGRSSALYLLVLQPAFAAVGGPPPLPVLVPRVWDVFPGAFDSLFAAALDGRQL
jgi:hypothetical protein